MSNHDDAREPTTWDGQRRAEDPPYGATIVVYRLNRSVPEFLLLHRGQSGPDFEGDWAWTPPAGARLPGEKISDCAKRELKEEAGLTGEPEETLFGSREWAAYSLEVGADVRVTLHDTEHDRYEWVALKTAEALCSPEIVMETIRRVAAQVKSAD